MPVITNYANKVIFASGRGGPDYKIVEMYKLNGGAWSFAPSLNVGRINHSSLVLGRMIYFFFGSNMSKNEKSTDSLERLDAEAHINRE